MRCGISSFRIALRFYSHQSHSYCPLLYPLPSAERRVASQNLRPFSPCSSRSAKTKTTVKIRDLPQGKLVAPSAPVEELDNDGPSYPTVMQQAWNNMRKFENCVLLTRVGGFYEFYFEHAEEYGPLLNLKVAKKGKNNVSMVSHGQKGKACYGSLKRCCRLASHFFNWTAS